MGKNSDVIKFILNGNPHTVEGIDLTKSVLNYLRSDLHLVGTKEGCAEGDCGACTIVIASLTDDNGLQMRAVNACIQFVPMLNGKAVYTVEYLRKQSAALHPVQKAMVDCHGSQCGFCTPGFIMSMWNVYVEHTHKHSRANDQQLRTALSGNLCRCTGYKPILEAGRKMFDLPVSEFDRDGVIEQLKSIHSEQPLEYLCANGNGVFYAPKTIKQLVELRSKYPKATILAGSTDIGLWVNKQFKALGNIIYIDSINELKLIQVQDDELYIGAGVSLNEAFNAIAEYYPQINEQWERFASVPIRNAGTLGGNVANGSPIGDSMPWLITLNAKVKLTSHNASRVLPLEDLYVDYMKKSMAEDEVVEAVIVPVLQPQIRFRTYKLSKRYDSDISAVCAAFSITLNDKKISHARVAYGGMAAIPKRATLTEATLNGQLWNEQTAKNAAATIGSDFSPLSDMRASGENRLQSAENLLYRFYLETRPDDPLSADQVSVFESN